jgi:hypothetical protein
MTTLAPLAAILTDRSDVDRFFAEIADALAASGMRVRGALQSRGHAGAAHRRRDMDLTTLTSGRTFRISQPLGAGARGCRLDAGALAACSAFLAAELHAGADLLILNRFGRDEGEGRGFRDLIGTAMELDVPVLTAVRPTHADSWVAFGADAACALPMDREAVLAWAATMMAIRDAA